VCEWVEVCLFVLLLSQLHNQPDVYESEDPEPVTSTTCDDTASGAVEQLPSGVKTAYGQFSSRLLDSRFTGTSHNGQVWDMG